MRALALLLLVVTIILHSSANTECLWMEGQVRCSANQTHVLNTVIEVWDKDGPREIGAIDVLDPDDKAGFTVVDTTTGDFRVEGCASDVDWLGPLHHNRPEFYLKIRHRCNTTEWRQMELQLPRTHARQFAPQTMDYYQGENAIELV